MMRGISPLFPRVAALLLAPLTLTLGCGVIADKDLIKIAKRDGTYITRGVLAKYIREMPDEERPIIHNKGDILKVLNTYIDDSLKIPLGKEVEAEFVAKNQTFVPREQAMKQFFTEKKEDDYDKMYFAKKPEDVGLTAPQLEALRQQIDARIDQVFDRMRGDAALVVRGAKALKEGSLTITDEDFDREYKLRKSELKKFEWAKFRAIRFPANIPNTNPEVETAEVRRRIDAGEDFDKLFEEYKNRNAVYAFESEIENNPGLERFRGFWLNASGAEPGTILGPMFLPEYQVMATDAQGQQQAEVMPSAYLVIKIVEHQPETEMTLEEAKQSLVPPILTTKMMAKLRQDHGVEVYEKKLPDPTLFTDQYQRSFADKKNSNVN